ncbi:MAG: c-type cytochrome, partial [Planctomycetes bacterium]|nr:c-type cytochrome [Planctomycetota bacterium]
PASRLRLGFTSDTFPESPHNWLDGWLDEVMVYDRVLSEEEIRALCPDAPDDDLYVTAVALIGDACGCQWETTADGQLRLRIPPASRPRRVKLLIWKDYPERLPGFRRLVASSSAPADLTRFTHGGPPRWPQRLTTTAQLGDGPEPYVIDTITHPVDNPWHSWLRFSAFDFFSDGRRAAISTWNGDVWLVSGLGGKLKKLTWQRIATGLFQPLGLKIVDDQIYVNGRDQITRLHDLNGDGEIDFYENFNNDHQVTDHFHEFAMDLQTDADGNFYYAKCGRHALPAVVPQHGTMIRVSKDGSRSEILCNGFRAANGIGIGPKGEWVNTDQEGHWTPANRVNLVRPGRFYGYVWSYHEGPDPTTYDPPICWLPKNVDRSPAQPLWVTSDRWGPLKGQLITTSYGTGQIFLVPYEVLDGQPQGGAVRFDLSFPTGIMRGKFNRRDGQLYVCGLFGWSSDKTQPGGFYRVRYTGQPVDMPVGFHVAQNGIRLTFTRPLDRRSAEDVHNYSLKQWNYRWTANYGSEHYKVSNPKETGFDRLEVRSATLEPDGRTVFLEISDLQPVMQLQISYTLRAADGAAIQQDLYSTINVLGPLYRSVREPIAKMRLPSHDGRSSEEPSDADPEPFLKPGLAVRFDSGKEAGAADNRPAADARVVRLAALHVPAGEAPSPFISPGPFRAIMDGYLRVDLKGRYLFGLRGTGQASLVINGRLVRSASGRLSQAPFAAAELKAGLNRLRIVYEAPKDLDAVFRLYWKSDRFAAEPIPPTALWHDRRDPTVQAGLAMRLGRELFATRQCLRCHPSPRSAGPRGSMPELRFTPPRLTASAARFRERWLQAWLLDPATVRNKVFMPRVLVGDTERQRRDAADIAAYLISLRPPSAGPMAGGTAESRRSASTTGPTGGDQPAVAASSSEPSAQEARSGNERADQGELLFEDLGCIACHTFLPPNEPDEYDRISLAHIDAKYQPGALAAFLRRPSEFFPGTRMPDLQLTELEAQALAAFLRSRSRSSGLELAGSAQPGDPARGKQLFAERGCNQCHAIQAQEELPAPNRRPLFASAGNDPRKLSGRGCLAATEHDRADAPDFSFSAEQRRALATFLSTDGASLQRCVFAEASERLVDHFRCTACHKRDGDTPVWPIVLVEEGVQGRLPEYVPELTWIGEKLKPAWTEKLFAGQLNEKPRPWLKARMPIFPLVAHELAVGLSRQHGFGENASTADDLLQPTHPPDAFDRGRQLTLNTQGFNCVQCHDVGDQPAVAPFENRGVNFEAIPERLRYDFYIRWMRDATRLEFATRMPRLSPAGQRTEITDVYDGDARRQFDAIWGYILSLRRGRNRERGADSGEAGRHEESGGQRGRRADR